MIGIVVLLKYVIPICSPLDVNALSLESLHIIFLRYGESLQNNAFVIVMCIAFEYDKFYDMSAHIIHTL